MCRLKKMKMPGKCEGPRWMGMDSNHKLKNTGERNMVRGVDTHGECPVWCRKCWGCVRCRLRPNMMNRSRVASARGRLQLGSAHEHHTHFVVVWARFASAANHRPSIEWGWSHPVWHMWWTGRGTLGHSRQHCRLRSPHFRVASVGESERGFQQSTTLSSTQRCLKRQEPTIQTIPKTVEVPQSPYLNRAMDIPGVTQRLIPRSEVAKNSRFHSVLHWQIYGWTIGNVEAGHHDRVAGVRAVPQRQFQPGRQARDGGGSAASLS